MKIDDAITPKMRAFALEYCLDHDGKNAAIRAGYSAKTAHVRACKLLKHPEVKLLIEKLDEKSRKDFEIERADIIWRLWAHMTRDIREYMDEDGFVDAYRIKHELPDREAACIDGIKQKIIKRWTEEDGTQVEILQTEVRLTPLAAARNDAMRYHGLFAQDNSGGVTVTFPDLSRLFTDGSHIIDVNPVSQRLEAEQQKLLPNSSNEGNGDGKK